MNFFEWLTTRRKTLGSMNATELRAQEMLLCSERDRMAARVNKLATDKQKLVERGAKEKTPELRRTLAQQFDLLHTEQMMLAKHLNIRSKEALTVTRLRMLRESAERSGASVAQAATGLIRESDLALIERLIENDTIGAELYQERLDEILRLSIAGTEGSGAISAAGQELMKIWSDMDAGLIKDAASATEEAERRMRERQKAADG